MKIVALAGGVGGAKLAHGLSKVLNRGELSIIVNTADDFTHYGLFISPDIDTVCYTLGEIASKKTGWGREGETFHTLNSAIELGGPSWFMLGDKDLGLHLERARLLHAGKTLTQTTDSIRQSLGIPHSILPMSDDKVSTRVLTISHGEMAFQDYFVKEKCKPVVTDFKFDGIELARPSNQVKNALEAADEVIVCPSNPFVSIGPILALPGIKAILRTKRVTAVSPIIAGKAVKGPLAKMLKELNYDISPVSIAKMYQEFLSVVYIDLKDAFPEEMAHRSGIIINKANIMLPDIKSRVKLAEKIIQDFKR